MSSMLFRIILAVVCVGLAILLLPPIVSLIGLPVPSEVLTIIRICLVGLGILYVLKGPPFPPTA